MNQRVPTVVITPATIGSREVGAAEQPLCIPDTHDAKDDTSANIEEAAVDQQAVIDIQQNELSHTAHETGNALAPYQEDKGRAI